MKVPKKEITSGWMVRRNFMEGTILMKNGKNLAFFIRIVGGDCYSRLKETMSITSRAGMHGILRSHRCMIQRSQEKGSEPHFQCDECHGQEVGLYSGVVGNHCLTLSIGTEEMT